MSIGKTILDLKGINIKGDSLAISDLVGKNKVMLLDFWASWCGPCRAFTPSLKEIYKKYQEKGFEIVGITLDDDRAAWEAASKKDEIPWNQIAIFEGDKIYDMYGFRGIPFTIIVDEKGVIQDKGNFIPMLLEYKIRLLLE